MGSGTPVQSVDAVTSSEAWYGGAKGELIQWANGTVTTHTTGLPIPLTSLQMLSSTAGWAGTSDWYANNYLVKYANGSTTNLSMGTTQINGIALVSLDEGWFATTRYGSILHYRNGVQEWQSLPAVDTVADSVSMIDANHGWAAGYYYPSVAGADLVGKVFKYTNETWAEVAATPVITGTDGDLMVMGIGSDEAWLAGYSMTCSGTECRSLPQLHHYSNGAWTSVPLPAWRALLSIDKVSATEWWAAGKLNTGQSAFLHYSSGTYETVSAAGEDVQAVAMLPDGKGFAHGVGSLLKTSIPLPVKLYLPLVLVR